MVEFIEWHVDDICDDCLGEDECTQCHRDLVDINTYDFIHRLIANSKEFPDWKGVAEIYFTTDSTWLCYGGKDAYGNILITRMIPIHSIDNIHIDSTEPKFSESKINYLYFRKSESEMSGRRIRVRRHKQSVHRLYQKRKVAYSTQSSSCPSQ